MKNVIMFDKTKSLYQYCKELNIPYYRIAYRFKNFKNKSINEILTMPPNGSIRRIKYYVTYKDKKMALSTAMKQFFKDNNLYISTNAGFFTKKIKNGLKPQALFDDYCYRVLKRTNRI